MYRVSNVIASVVFDHPTLNQPAIPPAVPISNPGFNARIAKVWRSGRLQECCQTDLFQVALLLAVYVPLHRLFIKLPQLPESAYFAPSLLLQACTFPQILLLLGLIAAWTAVGWKRISWQQAESNGSIRLLVSFLALVLCWTFSSYDFNFFYGQGHSLDRSLLVILGVLVIRSPLFLPPFIAWGLLLEQQFEYPLNGYVWVDKRVLFDVLILYQVTLLIGLKLKIRQGLFVWLALCMQASNYFLPGWGKLVSGWAFHEQLDNLFVASYLNGWLGFMQPEQVLELAGWIQFANRPLVLGALLLELSTLFLLWRKAFCITLLSGCILLHAGIYLTAGILFWKWQVLDVALIVLLLSAGPALTTALFQPRRALLSVILIACSPLYFKPVSLAWHDTGLNDTFRLEAVGASGQVYEVPRTFMAPYDTLFAQNRLQYLTRDKFLVGTYGATSSDSIAARLAEIQDPQDVQTLCDNIGDVRFNPERIARFDRFLQSFFKNLNAGTEKGVVPRWIQPPHHIQSSVSENRFERQETVRSLRVIHVRSHYHEGQIDLLKTALVHEVVIDGH